MYFAENILSAGVFLALRGDGFSFGLISYSVPAKCALVSETVLLPQQTGLRTPRMTLQFFLPETRADTGFYKQHSNSIPLEVEEVNSYLVALYPWKWCLRSRVCSASDLLQIT